MDYQQQPSYRDDRCYDQQTVSVHSSGSEPRSFDRILETIESTPENEFIKGELYRAVRNLAQRRNLAAATDLGLIVHYLLSPICNNSAGQLGYSVPVTHTLHCSNCGAAIQVTA